MTTFSVIDTIHVVENHLAIQRTGSRRTMIRMGILLGLAVLGLIAMFDEFFDLPDDLDSEWAGPAKTAGQGRQSQQGNNAGLF